jgi:excisionase family DNA binding protein
MHMKNDLLNIDESAAFLKLKSSTLRDWILHRRIPFVKMGRRVLLRRSDLKALIESSVVCAGGARRHGK